MPRCNNDTFFASSLCPSEASVDPPAPWTLGCDSCVHSCLSAGGVCGESKQEIRQEDGCPAHQNCSSCTASHRCSWCAQPPSPQTHCRRTDSKLSCAPDNLLVETAQCEECETLSCHPLVKSWADFGSKFCSRGDLRCGRCACPAGEGRSGRRCECQTGAPAPPPAVLHSPPLLTSAQATGTRLLLQGQAGEPLTFGAALSPPGCDRCKLACNANLTRCTNPNTVLDKKCSAGGTSMAMYGSHRLVPGSRITVVVKSCTDKTSSGEFVGGRTKLGLAVPPSHDQESHKDQDERYWVNEAYILELGKMKWGERERFSARYRWAHANPDSETAQDELILSDCPHPRPAPRTAAPACSYKYDYPRTANITLEVTQTEVIWTIDGLKVLDRWYEPTEMKDIRHPIDIMKKEFYPLFVLPSCTNQEQSVIEILATNMGQN